MSHVEVHLAICDDNRCPWKHRGLSASSTVVYAARHRRMTGHKVTRYEDGRKVPDSRSEGTNP